MVFLVLKLCLSSLSHLGSTGSMSSTRNRGINNNESTCFPCMSSPSGRLGQVTTTIPTPTHSLSALIILFSSCSLSFAYLAYPNAATMFHDVSVALSHWNFSNIPVLSGEYERTTIRTLSLHALAFDGSFRFKAESKASLNAKFWYVDHRLNCSHASKAAPGARVVGYSVNCLHVGLWARQCLF